MKRLLYVDMDDVLCDYTGAYEHCRKCNPNERYPQSVKGFFENLKPIEGAIEAIDTLVKNFDLYLLTAPSTRNPLCYTEKRIWVEAHLGYDIVKRLIISPNKSLLKGDFLVDDHIEGRGQEKFSGELIHFGSSSYETWSAVLSYLLR